MGVSNLSPWTKDISGQRFGKLIVVSYAGFCGTRHAHWNCRCDCGAARTVRGTKLNRENVSACARCSKRDAASRGAKKRELDLETAGSRSAETQYRINARQRNIPFELSSETVTRFFKGDCYYCGSPPSTSHKLRRQNPRYFLRNGIDRLDNDKGYIVGNVVSCCATCNFAKREMSSSKFVAWILRAHAHIAKHS